MTTEISERGFERLICAETPPITTVNTALIWLSYEPFLKKHSLKKQNHLDLMRTDLAVARFWLACRVR